MAMLLRRLRGIMGTAAFWGLIWLPIGVVLELLLARQPTDVLPPPFLVMIGVFTGWGAVSGASFAVVLAIAERNHALADLSLLRVGVWGAVGCVLLPALLIALDLHHTSSPSIGYDWGYAGSLLAVCGVLGAICAAVTLTLARRAPSP